jgi:methylglutaconyl-CoA hydratase
MMVLAAEGRAFCAGADVAWMQRAAAQSEAANLEDAYRLSAMMEAVAECQKPVVARVQGAAFGGGVGLACAADIVIASERASFALSETRLGILPAVIGPYVAHAIGVRQAKRLALTGQRVGAAEGLRLGLVHELVAEVDLDAALERCIAELLLGGPCAQRASKEFFGRLAAGPVSPATRESAARTISQLRATAEAAEGFAAFNERRPASWVRSER